MTSLLPLNIAATAAGQSRLLTLTAVDLAIIVIYFAVVLAIGLIAIEYLIRMREKSKWTPPPTEGEQ